MKLATIMAVAVIVLAGCSSDDEPTTVASDAVTTTVEVTTTVDASGVLADELSDMIDAVGVDAATLAELAETYCSDLKVTDSATAKDNLRDELARAITASSDLDIGKAADAGRLSAQLMVSQLADAAKARIC